MKKIKIVIMFLLLLGISGCRNSKDVSNISSREDLIIPFLMYEKDIDSKKLKANLSYWDLGTGNIDMDKKTLYTMELEEQNDLIEPVAWDGVNILLHKKATPSDIDKNSIKTIDDYTFNNIIGKDIRMVRNLDENDNVKDYTLYLNTENGVVEKTGLFIYNSKNSEESDIKIDTFPSWIDFNKNTGEITFICVDNVMLCSKIYVAKSNIDNIDKIDWSEIELEKEIISGGQNIPSVYTSILIGNKYYIQSNTKEGISSLAEIDIEKKTSKLLNKLVKECRSIVEEGKYNPEHLKEIKPVGSYKNILIVSVPISTDTHLEYLMCAYKNNKFLGAIHLNRNDNWDIIDSKKNVISTLYIKNRELELRFGEYLSFPVSVGWY